MADIDLNYCCRCGRKLEDKYAVLWGPEEQPASVVGFLCMDCSEQFKDITEEVTEAED
jgi:DNA-directed RNA polymerase subunit RPC12/RpoP